MKIVFIALCLVLSACGFHLRTWDLDSAITSAYVHGETYGTFVRDLQRALTQAGVSAAEDAQSAEVVIHLLDEEREQRSVSVTGLARAAEYELTLGVRYQAVRKLPSEDVAQALIEPRWVRIERIYQVDRDNIVGSSSERALLEQEMKNELIGQIIRALNTVIK